MGCAINPLLLCLYEGIYTQRARKVPLPIFPPILCLLRLNLWVAVCAETTCITPSSELQCRQSETQNASRPAPVNIHRKPGGKRFWPHRLPHTAPEHSETVEIWASKSKWNKLKSTKKRYKWAKKVFLISLGAGGPGFESPHSDQKLWKSAFLGGFLR